MFLRALVLGVWLRGGRATERASEVKETGQATRGRGKFLLREARVALEPSPPQQSVQLQSEVTEVKEHMHQLMQMTQRQQQAEQARILQAMQAAQPMAAQLMKLSCVSTSRSCSGQFDCACGDFFFFFPLVWTVACLFPTCVVVSLFEGVGTVACLLPAHVAVSLTALVRTGACPFSCLCDLGDITPAYLCGGSSDLSAPSRPLVSFAAANPVGWVNHIQLQQVLAEAEVDPVVLGVSELNLSEDCAARQACRDGASGLFWTLVALLVMARSSKLVAAASLLAFALAVRLSLSRF
eukprot:5925644-Amphidinium_carterae.1